MSNEEQREYTVELIEKYEEMNNEEGKAVFNCFLVGASLVMCYSGMLDEHQFLSICMSFVGIVGTIKMYGEMNKINGIRKDIEELKQELGLGELETEKRKSR